MQTVALDTETLRFGPGLMAPPIVCVAFAPGGLHHVNETAREQVESLLRSDDLIVGHYVAYDMGCIAAQWPELLPLIFAAYDADRVTDTGIREKLQHIALGVLGGYADDSGKYTKLYYSLAQIAYRRLEIELPKDEWRTEYGKLLDVPLADWPAGAIDYAESDAQAAWVVWQDQEEEGREFLRDQYRQSRADFFLRLMSCWGLTTDPAGVQAFADRTRKARSEIEAKLIEAGLVRPNGSRDTKAAKARMLATGTVSMTKTAEKKKLTKEQAIEQGLIALDKDACDQSSDPILRVYAEYSGLGKRLSEDVPLLEQRLIHSRFDLVASGRTSSSPNVQNRSRTGGVRECFVPRPGYVYAIGDYSQFELRTWAQVCKSVLKQSRMADALNGGLDPHLDLAARMLGITYAEAQARDVDAQRQTAKVANFGFPGGLGIKRFVHFARKSYGVELTEKEADDLKKFWFAAWPEARPYFDWISGLTEDGDAQIGQLQSHRIRGGLSFPECCNTFFQGLAADAAKHAGWLICKACYNDPRSPLYGCRPVNFVHDEFIVEVPDDARAHDAAEELARLMVAGASEWLPDVPPKVEPLLARCWSKKAKPVKDSAGRLVPWAQ